LIPHFNCGAYNRVRERFVSSQSHQFLFLLLVGVCILSSSCTTTSTLSEEPVLSTIAEPCEQPVLDLLPESPSIQTHGSITIDVAIVVPECQPVIYVKSKIIEKPPTAGQLLTSLISTSSDDPTYIYEIKEEEALRVSEYLQLEFTITNQSERVFRPQGAVWQALLSGTVLSEDRAGDAKPLLNMVLAPGQNRTVYVNRIYHPGTADDGAVFAFSLYDVVVDRDVAGIPVQRSSFEWFYSLRYQSIEQPMTNRALSCTHPIDSELEQELEKITKWVPASDHDPYCL